MWILIAITLVVGPFAQERQAGAHSATVSVAKLDFDAPSSIAALEIENHSDRGATGWVLRLTTDFADGTESTAYLSRDFAKGIGLERAIGESHFKSTNKFHDGGLMAAGQVHLAKITSAKKEGTAVVDFRAEIVAVVYEDLSFSGDKNWVSDILRGREAARLVYDKWLPQIRIAYEESPTESDFREELSEILRRLTQSGEIYGNNRVSSQSTSAKTAERDISSLLDQVLNSPHLKSKDRYESQIALEVIEAQHEELGLHVTYDLGGHRIKQLVKIK